MASAGEEAHEESLEKEALHKAIHRPLKVWYRSHGELEEKYGEFPLFWKELSEWSSFRDVYRLYQKDLAAAEQSKNAREDGAGTAIHGSDSGAATVGVPAAKPEQGLENGSSAKQADAPRPKKRRRSRFSDAVPDAKVGTSTTRRRVSRFSADTDECITEAERKTIVLRAQLEDLKRKFMMLPRDAAEKERLEGDKVQPIYDTTGKRTNRLIDRMRADLEKQRQHLMSELVKVDPTLRGKVRLYHAI